MRKSTGLLTRLGDLYGDIELAIYKLIKNDGSKTFLGTVDNRLGDGDKIEVSVRNNVHGRVIYIKCADGNTSDWLFEKPLKDCNVDFALDVLVALEDIYGVEEE